MRVVVSLTVLLPLLLVAGAAAVEPGRPASATASPSSRNVITRRRVNWWFNALNSSFGSHQAAVAAAHRQAITGVYQWIQPEGFWVKADGSVSFPPDENILAATAPLLAMGLESGVCMGLAPGSLESGGALGAIPALVAAAEKFNITSYIVDLEYPGPTPIPAPPAPGTTPAGNNGSTWRKDNSTGAWHNGTCLAPPWVCWSNVYVGTPRGPLYAGRSTGGVADIFYTDVRSILLMVLWHFKGTAQRRKRIGTLISCGRWSMPCTRKAGVPGCA